MPVLAAVRTTRTALPWTRPLKVGMVGWHLLSLDAPTVAAVWTWAVGRSVGLTVPVTLLSAMFVAVWMLYAADRLLDAAAGREQLESRHRFHARHRRAFLLALGGAGVVLLLLLPSLPAETIRVYAILATALLVWFALIHGLGLRRLPKELAVGIFFAAAAWVPTLAREPALWLRQLTPALLFAALCSLNCLYISRWESSAGQDAFDSLRRHLPAATAVAGGLALALAVLTRSSVALSLLLSAALLAGLDRWRPRQPVLLRACADLVLLTPLLWCWRP